MTIDLNDPRLTAYALGELTEAERGAVETALAESPGAREAVDEIRATAESLETALRSEPLPRLATEQRAAITATQPATATSLFRFGRTFVGLAASLMFVSFIGWLAIGSIYSRPLTVQVMKEMEIERRKFAQRTATPPTEAAVAERPEATTSIDDIGREATRRTRAKLKKVAPEFTTNKMPLETVVRFLRDSTGINIIVQWAALEQAGIEKEKAVTIEIFDTTYENVLKSILESLAIEAGTQLAYDISDGVLTITTMEMLSVARPSASSPTSQPIESSRLVMRHDFERNAERPTFTNTASIVGQPTADPLVAPVDATHDSTADGTPNLAGSQVATASDGDSNEPATPWHVDLLYPKNWVEVRAARQATGDTASASPAAQQQQQWHTSAAGRSSSLGSGEIAGGLGGGGGGTGSGGNGLIVIGTEADRKRVEAIVRGLDRPYGQPGLEPIPTNSDTALEARAAKVAGAPSPVIALPDNNFSGRVGEESFTADDNVKHQIAAKISTLTALRTELEMQKLGRKQLWDSLDGMKPDQMPLTAELQTALKSDPHVSELQSRLDSETRSLEALRTARGTNSEEALRAAAAVQATTDRLSIAQLRKLEAIRSEMLEQARRDFYDAAEQEKRLAASIAEAQTRLAIIETSEQNEYIRRRNQQLNTENYAPVVDNPFLTATQNPLSTFSIDVDTASYANVRRFLNAGQLPPPDAVRIEELLNYFTYDYPPPAGGDEAPPFSANMEVAECPWAPTHRLVRIGLKGRTIASDRRPKSNLAFLIDVSGSMDEPNKLPLVKRAMQMLTSQLGENDRVAMVVYAGSSGLVLPSTTADHTQAIMNAIENLSAGGSTNGGEGINLAYDIAQQYFVKGGVNRVILCTDGDFNVGVTSPGDLTRMIEEKAKSGVFLSVFGFGMGNLKDSTLESLADKGNGNYGYIDTLNEARKVFVEQLSGTLVTIAKDVKIQVEFNPAKVAAYRLIGYENRLLRAEDFNNDQKDAGEIGAGHTVTALYELVPVGQPIASGVDPLKYQQPPAVAPAATGSNESLTLKLRYKQPDGETSKLLEFPATDSGKGFAQASPDFQFAAAVAAFGMQLRNSPHKGSWTLNAVREVAQQNRGADPFGYRAEFTELVGKARGLAGR